jgi:hypothetical protein
MLAFRRDAKSFLVSIIVVIISLRLLLKICISRWMARLTYAVHSNAGFNAVVAGYNKKDSRRKPKRSDTATSDATLVGDEPV